MLSSEITALALVKQNPHIISFGTASGALKDYDMKTRKVVRTASRRHKSPVTKVISFSKYVVSLSADLVYVYDHAKQ